MTRKIGRIGTRSLLAGLVGGTAMAAFYVLVVRAASGSWDHLLTQVRQDWYLLVIILAGFSVQVAVLVELRRRRRLYASAVTVGGAGAGASVAGMIAC